MPQDSDIETRVKKLEELVQAIIRVENVEQYEMLKRRLLDDNFTQT